jgi:hypothetical protein
VRFTADEYAELAAAATRAGLTTTGYVGEAALAAARGVNATGEVDTGAITRAELAALQRDLFAARTAVNQAAAAGRYVSTARTRALSSHRSLAGPVVMPNLV